MKKLKDVFKGNDPFVMEEGELLNIITKAVMPVAVKEAVLKRDKIGQNLFETFVKERIVERKLSVWIPKKKVNLQTWKTPRVVKKSKTALGVATLKDDRAHSRVFLLCFFRDLRLTSRKASVNSSWLRFHNRSLILMVTFAIVLARAS